MNTYHELSQHGHNHSETTDLENAALDLNQAASQSYSIIPSGTCVKVRLTIQPGGHGTNGWLTQNDLTRSVYLNVQFKVTEGEYTGAVLYHRIGMKGTKVNSQGQDIWGTIGRSQLRAIVESAYGVSPHDQSDSAHACRCLASLGALNGLICAIKVGKEKARHACHTERNTVMQIITPDMPNYDCVMSAAAASLAAPADQPNSHGNASE